MPVDIEEIKRALEPEVMAWIESRIQQIVSGGGAQTVSTIHNHQDNSQGGKLDHGLSEAGLLDDDHPQYASADGSGTRTAYQAQRLNRQVIAGDGLNGGGMLTGDVTLQAEADVAGGLQVLAAGIGLNTPGTLSASSANARSGSHTHEVTASSNPGAAAALLKTSSVGELILSLFQAGRIIAGEIKAGIFSRSEVVATAGTLIIPKSAGKLRADVTTVASPTTFTIDVDDPPSGHAQTFANGDILRMANGVTNNWMTISAVSDQTTFYRYTVTLNSGSPATFYAGQGIIDYGTSGFGFLEMSSDQNNAPYYSVKTHAGAPYTTLTERVRVGNLNGFLSYVTNLFGIGIGDANNYLTYDPTNGLKVKGTIVTSQQNPVGFGVWDEDVAGVINGSNTAFNVAQTFVAGTLQVIQNGLWRRGGGNEYSELANTIFTMNIAPATGDVLRVTYSKASDGSTVYNETPSGSINGSNVTFTLANAYIAGSLQVSLNGVTRDKGGDYSESIGFNMVTAPATGDVLIAAYQVDADANWVYQEVAGGSINGSNTVFTTANAYVSGTLVVIKNGLRFMPTADYTEGSSQFTMNVAPVSGDSLWVIYKKS